MQEVVQDKEFLRGYEVKNWNFSPRIYKILAASAILNLAAIMVFAQTNLLTQRGCDSPFVSTVCDVIATVYVGNSLFGTDGEYVVRDYNKTEIGEDEEVTFIDVSNMTPPISYPPGYFAVANPDQYSLDANGMVVPKSYVFENMTPPNTINPTIPNNPAGLMNTAPNFPAPGKNLATGKVPDSPFSIGGNPTVNNPTTGRNNNRKGGKNPTLNNDPPTELPNFDGDETADKNTETPPLDEKTAKNSDPVKEVETNRKPILDLTDFVIAKSANNEYKLDLKPFKVVLDGKLIKKLVKDEKGEEKEVVAFDPKTTRWNTKEETGDKEMIEIARQAIERVGDSGFLGYLYNFEAENIQITLQQVDDNVIAIVKSDMKTEQKAATVASGLNFYIAGAKRGLKGNDVVSLMNGIQKPTSNEKFLIIEFKLSKEAAQEMIQRNLIEAAKKKEEVKKEAEAKKNTKNSTAQTINSNANTGK